MSHCPDQFVIDKSVLGCDFRRGILCLTVARHPGLQNRHIRALVRKHAGAEHTRHSRAYHSHLCPGWQVCPAFAARVRGT